MARVGRRGPAPDGDNEYHVVPHGDIVHHETAKGSECVCGPRTEVSERKDGALLFTIVHHALDGRK